MSFLTRKYTRIQSCCTCLEQRTENVKKFLDFTTVSVCPFRTLHENIYSWNLIKLLSYIPLGILKFSEISLNLFESTWQIKTKENFPIGVIKNFKNSLISLILTFKTRAHAGRSTSKSTSWERRSNGPTPMRKTRKGAGQGRRNER